jgi:serine/threonine-protein kinase HipA
MRKADIFFDKVKAAVLIEHNKDNYEIIYDDDYQGPPVSLTLPLKKTNYVFDSFPAFFEGLLPEGPQLEALLRQKKIDKSDYFSQLIAVGQDMVGAVTVKVVTA